MKRNEAKNYILENATRLLEKDKSGKGYICPLKLQSINKNEYVFGAF